MVLKTKNWSHLEEDQTVERRKGKLSQKGMEICIDLYGTTKLGMDRCFCLVNGLHQT